MKYLMIACLALLCTSCDSDGDIKNKNEAPTGSIRISPNKSDYLVRETITFEAVNMGDDSDIVDQLQVSWNFGDEENFTEPSFIEKTTHSYEESGTYNITLIVIDTEGKEFEVMGSLVVKAVVGIDEAFLGADLSYVNEMEDCGGTYFENEIQRDVYELFAERGANIVRLRLWHHPQLEGLNYSDYEDVEEAIMRSKAEGMKVLLDFHYSDFWADPGRQWIPAAWVEVINSKDALGDSLYNYTYSTLEKLAAKNLLPDIVQVGNEINGEILQPHGAGGKWPINWERNGYVLNKGLQAVADAAADFGQPIDRMLHIAQPENAVWWFGEAHDNGIGDYEWIGLSYYGIWSDKDFDGLASDIDKLKTRHGKRVMVVETSYPYSVVNSDALGNIHGFNSAIEGYPITPEGQRNYLFTLTQTVIDAGGEGVIYWEPAWISTSCTTPWGTGSSMENATFFDAENNNEALPAFDFLNPDNY